MKTMYVDGRFRKRLLSLMLVVLMVSISLGSLGISAARADVADVFSYMGVIYTVLTESGDTGTVQVGNANSRAVPVDITSVVIPQTVPYSGKTYTVTTIGIFAFAACANLTHVELPGSITTISGYAFDGCYSLVDIELPNSVTSTGSNVFNGCRSLKSMTIPDSMTAINENTFNDCRSLESVVIPNSITYIGRTAFLGCHALESIFIPNSVTTIGAEAFGDCRSLASIDLEDGNQNYVSVDGVLYSKDQTLLFAYPGGKTGSSFTVPDSVATIGASAFRGNAFLTDVTIPDSVSLIEHSAFASCTGLTDFVIPYGTTVINNNMFSYCTNLSNVVIPDTVVTIGDFVFSSCNSLRHVEIPHGVETIGNAAYYYCLNLESVRIPSSVTTFGPYAFGGSRNLYDVYFASPTPATSILSSSFSMLRAGARAIVPYGTTAYGNEGSTWYGLVVTFDEPPPSTIQVSSEAGEAGDEVHIALTMLNNPGIKSLGLEIAYDSSVIRLEGVASTWDGMAFSSSPDLSSNPFPVTWASETGLNNTDDGAILDLTFTILPGVADGVYPVTITYDPLHTFDENNIPLEPPLFGGNVIVGEIEQPALIGEVTLTGDARYGMTLTSVTSGLSATLGVTPHTLSYQWKRDGVENVGSNLYYYYMQPEDIGRTISVTVTAINCVGSVTSAPTEVITKGVVTTLPDFSALVSLNDEEIQTVNPSRVITTYRHANDNLVYTLSGEISGNAAGAIRDLETSPFGIEFKVVGGVEGQTATLPVTVSGLANYEDMTINVVLTLTEKGLAIVTASPPGSIVYGEALGDPSATVAGDIGDHSFNYRYLGTLATVGGGTAYNSAEKPVNPGTYYVLASLASDTHMGSAVSGNFTIERKALSWDDNGVVAAKLYDGNTNATVITRPGLAGLINDDTVSVVNGSVAYTSSAVGTDTVTVANYGITGTHTWKYLAPTVQPVFYVGGIIDDADRPMLGGTVTISGVTEYGQRQTAVTSGLSSTPPSVLGALSYQWRRGGVAISG
ncbi:MAG: leucine-rich repeat protein, partial [Clostridiales bacterium]|nr:leucine-rich repeat protein [Clostridiales bacterium]